MSTMCPLYGVTRAGYYAWRHRAPSARAKASHALLTCIGRIVGWALGADRTVNLTARAMQRAIRSRAPAQALIFHSDRGIEYGAYRSRAFLTQRGIRPSMNRSRCAQDNAHMESFFHTMKIEWTLAATGAPLAGTRPFN